MSYSIEQEKGYNKKDILNNILTKDDYKFTTNDTYKYFSLQENVVCFFDGRKWNIIALNDMLAYPLLYFDFWSEKENTIFVNTVLVCPITMRSIIYKGIIKILDIVSDRLYLENTDTGDKFFMDSPYTGHFDKFGKEKKIKSHINRNEVKIIVLRDVYMFATDLKYIRVNTPKNTIISEKYYTNKLSPFGDMLYNALHPKTLVYVVQYYSQNIYAYRYTVIVGKNINRKNVTGYSYKKSGLWDYLNQYRDGFIKKKAYIYPVLWYIAQKLYSNAKIITILD